MMKRLLVAMLLWFPAVALAGEGAVVPTQRHAVTATIFPQPFALIRELRTAELAAGDNDVLFADVSGGAQLETARVAGKGVVPLAMASDPLLTSPESLLAHAVGTEVTLMRPLPGGGEKAERVRLLSVQGGLVVEANGHIEANPAGHVVLDEMPTGLRIKPAITVHLRADAPGRRDLALTYLARGLSWRPDYVLEWDGKDRMVLSGWASVTNSSGSDLTEAHLLLSSATPNRLAGPVVAKAILPGAMMMAAPAAAAASQAAEDVGGEVIWDMGAAVTLNTGQMRQFALLPARSLTVKATRRLENLYLGGNPQRNPQQRLPVLTLSFAAPSDLSLPAGVVHAYRLDAGGGAHFTGDGTLFPTAAGAPARLALGNDVNLPIEIAETDFQRDGSATEAAYTITVRNVSTEPAELEISPDLPAGWSVQEESSSHEMKGGQPLWSMALAGKQTASLSLRLRIVPPPPPKPR